MNRQAYTRLATALLGLGVIAVALWLAFTLSTVHCVYSGDAGSCQHRLGIKVAIGTGGVLVGALVLYVAAKMEN